MAEVKSLHERESELCQAIDEFAKGQKSYQAPEVLTRRMWSLFCVMSEHYAVSNGNAELPHVFGFLKHLTDRMVEDPVFAEELRQKVKEEDLDLSIFRDTSPML